MIVILCHDGDLPALWLYHSMRRAGVQHAQLVSIEEIAYSRRIVYRVSTFGDVGTVRLADGRTLFTEAVTGLVNRVRFVPTDHFARATLAERAYAREELTAFLLAWLNGIPGRVVNPPLPPAPASPEIPIITQLHVAANAGLPIGRCRVSTAAECIVPRLSVTHRLLLLDGTYFGADVPPAIESACWRFARLIGVPLLEIALHRTQTGDWFFQSATSLPDLRAHGPALALTLARTLGAQVGS